QRRPGAGLLLHGTTVAVVPDGHERGLDHCAIAGVGRLPHGLAVLAVLVDDPVAFLPRTDSELLEALVLAGHGVGDRLYRLHHRLAHGRCRVAEHLEGAVRRVDAVG